MPKFRGEQVENDFRFPGTVTIGNLEFSINDIKALDPNGDINLIPDGTGSVFIDKGSLTNTTLNAGCSVETALGWNSAQNFNGRNLSNAGNFTALTSGSTSWSLGLGDIQGLYPIYNSPTSVSMVRGFGEANGKFYNLNSNTVHNLTGLVSAFGFQYVYIDDSASSQPNATFINSLTAPVWNDAKMGWYGTGIEPVSPSIVDKCVGVVLSPDASATIAAFETGGSGKEIQSSIAYIFFPGMATNMNPTGSGFLTPNINDGSAVTPVNASKIRIRILGGDSNALISLFIQNAELAAINNDINYSQVIFTGYHALSSVYWIDLGLSRNMGINGNDNDENLMSMWCFGYVYNR